MGLQEGHTLSWRTDVQRKDGQVDDSEVVRAVYLSANI